MKTVKVFAAAELETATAMLSITIATAVVRTTAAKRISKRVKRQALSGALSSRAAAGDIRVVDGLKLDSISTKALVRILAALDLEEALRADKPVALLVTDQLDKNLALSARNIRGVRVGRAEDLNAFEVLKYRHLVVTKEGLARLQEVFS